MPHYGSISRNKEQGTRNKKMIGFGVELLNDVASWCKWVEDMDYDIDFWW
jgi:hypothetical protein